MILVALPLSSLLGMDQQCSWNIYLACGIAYSEITVSYNLSFVAFLFLAWVHTSVCLS